MYDQHEPSAHVASRAYNRHAAALRQQLGRCGCVWGCDLRGRGRGAALRATDAIDGPGRTRGCCHDRRMCGLIERHFVDGSPRGLNPTEIRDWTHHRVTHALDGLIDGQCIDPTGCGAVANHAGTGGCTLRGQPGGAE